MRRTRPIAILLAVLVTGAVASTSAMAAAPEFLTNLGVTPTSSIKGTSKTSTLYLKTAGIVITCSKDELLKASFVSGVARVGLLHFSGCNVPGCGEVKSKGAPNPEEINTNELESKLGYVSKTLKEVGEEIKPKTGGVFTTLVSVCLPTSPVNVEGGIVCKVEPVNVLQTTGKTVCGVTSKEQNIKKLEGRSEQTLRIFGAGVAFEGTEEETFAEAIETTA